MTETTPSPANEPASTPPSNVPPAAGPGAPVPPAPPTPPVAPTPPAPAYSAPPAAPAYSAAPAQPTPPVDYSAYQNLGSSTPRTPKAGSPSSPLGLLAAIAGAAGVLLGALFTLIQAAVAGTGNYSLLGGVSGTSTVLSSLLGLAALVIGGIALLTRQGSRVFAAVGVALGASLLIGAVSGLLYSAILRVTAGY